MVVVCSNDPTSAMPCTTAVSAEITSMGEALE